jgi:signal transduction histidine kinase
MSPARSTWGIVSVWVLVLGTYAAVSVSLPAGTLRATVGNVVLCIIPLFANAGLLLNAVSPYRRRNAFWMLLALGCTIWMAGQLLWTYFELGLHASLSAPFVGDAIFFLHIVPMIAALAVQPHARKMGETLRYGYLDLLLLALWWTYLYLFIVVPWGFLVPRPELYSERLLEIYSVSCIILLAGLAILGVRATGGWRRVYLHLFGAALLQTLASLATSWAIARGVYSTGSLYDVAMVASFLWFGTAGLIAHRLSPAPQAPRIARPVDPLWPARLAMVGVLSMPVLIGWSNFLSGAPEAVRYFRLLISLGAILVGTAFVFLRQHLVDRERLRLLRDSEDSLDNLKRLQTQFVQAEKLASLGQLAAGAAHEINNPLTAILGYSDLLLENAAAGDAAHSIANKIRAQARRTRSLVNNLLSFARQVPVEKTLLDLNTVLTGALELRTLDLRDKNIRIQLQIEPVLPAVRGDPNQLLQVFYHIVNNAVDAMDEMGGGTLTIRTLRDRANVAVEFSDTGAGIKEPNLVFDPFYTTKPVGKGTGLGLSICYGIVKEHGGQIGCYNRPEGGATFRVELPAVLAPFPQRFAPSASEVKVT